MTERLTNPCRNCCESFNGERYSWLPICEHCKERITYEKCLKTAEDEGRLVVLPCGTVYFIHNKAIRTKSILDLLLWEIDGIDKGGEHWSTREKAEKALKEMEEKQSE